MLVSCVFVCAIQIKQVLLTDNGDFARQLEHPSVGLRREYKVHTQSYHTYTVVSQITVI
jgi:16S rRNA U516 pseudouridylate synthase RsuA-like enzyme